MSLTPKLVGAATLLLAAPAVTAGIIYTDRTAFETALADFFTETFEDEPTSGTTGSGAVPSIAFDGFTVSTTPTAVKVLDAPAFGAVNTTPGGDTYLYIDTDSGFSGYEATFSLDAPTSAFGFSYSGNSNPGDVTTIMLAGGSFVLPESTPDAGMFWGYIADPGVLFDTAVLTATLNSAYGIDDVTFGRADGTVPEPATVALLGIGLGLIGLRKRRAPRP